MPTITPGDGKTRRRVKLVDEVIEKLRQEIVTRRLPDGERLPSEKDLSDHLGVSQPTVREAIRALETMGLVEVRHGSGSFVSSRGDFALASALQTLLQLQSVGIMDALEVRQVLGRHSISLAITRASDVELDALADCCTELDRLGPDKGVDDVIALVVGFQRALSAAAHSALLQSLEAFLLALLNEVQVKAYAARGMRFWKARALDFQPHRLAIVAGLRSRDLTTACTAMDGYFEAQRGRFEADATLRGINLSQPRAIELVAEMMHRFRD